MFFTNSNIQFNSFYDEPGVNLNPTSLGETWDASKKEAEARGQLLSSYDNLATVYDEHNKKVKDITGVELGNPTRIMMPGDGRDDERRQFMSDFDQYKTDGGGLNQLDYLRQWRENAYRKQLMELADKHPDKRGDLLPDRSFIEAGYAKRGETEQRVAKAWEKSNQGALDWMAWIGGQAHAGFTDPVNILTMPFGFGGVGTGAKGLAMAFLKNGGFNAGIEVAQQPFIQSNNAQAGDTSGWEAGATAVGGAFLLGGALDTAVRGTARGLRYGLGYEPVVRDGIVVGYRRKAEPGKDGAAPAVAPSPEADKSFIPSETVAKADDGDIKAIREVAERSGMADHPVVRQALDAMDANERLFTRPAEIIPQPVHDSAVTQALRHVSDPDMEPAPVVRLDASPEQVRDLESEVQVLRAEIRQVQQRMADGDPTVKPADAEALTAKLGETEAGFETARRALYGDDLIEAVDGGRIPSDVAEVVATHVENRDIQGKIAAEVMARRPVNATDARGMVAEIVNSPDYRQPDLDAEPVRALDDPYGPDAAKQVQQLEQQMAEELGRKAAPPPTPEDVATRVQEIVDHGAKVRAAIEEVAGVVPDGVEIRVFSAISDLPDGLAARVEMANAAAFAEAAKRLRDADSDLARASARRMLDDAVARQGIDGIAQDNTIWIASFAMDPKGRVAHEVVHALRTMGKLSPDELRLLATHGRDSGAFGEATERLYRKELESRGMSPERVAELLDEEAAAHAIEARVNAGEVPAPVKSVLDRIGEFFERVRNALRRQGFMTAEEMKALDGKPLNDVVQSFLTGEMAKRAGVKAWMRQEDLTAFAMRDGLDMSPAARKQRAEAMGFDTNTVWYHGTASNFDGFDKSTIGKVWGDDKDGFFFTNNPGPDMASGYAMRASKRDSGGEGSSVIPAYLKMQNPFTLETYAEMFGGGTPREILDGRGVVAWFDLNKRDIVSLALDAGHDGIVLTDPDTALISGAAKGKNESVGVVFGPANIRSVNAAFDPTKADSPNLMFAFAGERAKTADLEALARAKELEGTGQDRTAIWNATGWFRGVDGKWRFEIDDSNADWRLGTALKQGTGRLGDFLRHPELYDAYPEMQNYPASSQGVGASFDPSTNTVRVGSGTRGTSAGLHEGTHAVQSLENFAQGGNMEQMAAPMNSRAAWKARLPAAVRATLDERGIGRMYDSDDAWPAIKEQLRQQIEDDMGQPFKFHKLPGMDGMDEADMALEASRIYTAEQLNQQAMTALRNTGADAYNRLAGEVEARTVQKRMDLSPEQRRARPPWLDYDVPESQQIVRGASEPLFAFTDDRLRDLAAKRGATWIGDVGDEHPKGSVLGLHGTHAAEASKRFDIEMSKDIGIHIGTLEQASDFAGGEVARAQSAHERFGGMSVDSDSIAAVKSIVAQANIPRLRQDAVSFILAAEQLTRRSKLWYNIFRRSDARKAAEAAAFASRIDQTINEVAAYENAANALEQADGSLVVPVVLDVKNPVELPDMGTWKFGDVAAELYRRGAISKTASQRILAMDDDAQAFAAIRSELIANGYDAIRYKNEYEGAGWSYITIKEGTAFPAYASQGQPLFAMRSEPEIRQAMRDVATKGVKLPDGSMIQGIPLFAIRAYHGSPHDFDRFSMDHIGKGEGAQAYGHGLYFAENEGVAKSYRDTLSHKDGGIDGIAQSLVNMAGGDWSAAAAKFERQVNKQKAMADAAGMKYEIPDYDMRTLEALKKGQPGRLYEVKINADPEQFLDWNRRHSEHPPEMQAKLENITEYQKAREAYAQQFHGDSDMYGWGLIDQNTRNPKPDISQALREAGIPGIRYLDQGSRAAGEGSRNYVVFDDALIEIVAKDGKPLAGDPQFAMRDTDNPDLTPERITQAIQPYLDAYPNIARIMQEGTDTADLSPIITRIMEDIPALTEARAAMTQALGPEAAQAAELAVMRAIVTGESPLDGIDIDGITRQVMDALGPDDAPAAEPMFAMRGEDGRMKLDAQERAKQLRDELAAIEAQFQASGGDERLKLQAKRAALLGAQAYERLIDETGSLRDAYGRTDRAKAMMAVIENFGQREQVPFVDLVNLKSAIQNDAIGMMDKALWSWRKGAVLGDLRRKFNSSVKANMENVVRSLAGEKVTDQTAIEFGKAWQGVTEYLRQRFNAAGGDIAKLDGWIMPQYHDPEALLKGGREGWVKFIMPLLDRKRIVDASGAQLDDGKLRSMLQDIWTNITTDGAFSRELSDAPGKGVLYKRHLEHRVLHFKDADSWLAYSKKFGGNDIYAAMIGHISMMSRDIAMIERLGPNPDLTMRRLRQTINKEAAMAGPAISLFEEFQAKIASLKAEYKALPGGLDDITRKIGEIHGKLDGMRDDAGTGKRARRRIEGKLNELRNQLGPLHEQLEKVLSGEGMTPAQRLKAEEINAAAAEMALMEDWRPTSTNPVQRVNRLLTRADEMFKLYNGNTNVPADNRIASTMTGIRNIIGASSLVYAPFSAVTDQATQLAGRLFIGMPVTNQLASFVTGFTKGDRKLALAVGLGLDQVQAAFADQARMVGWYSTRHVTGYIADRTHAYSGLSPMTQAAKLAFGLDFMRWMASLKDTKFDALDDTTQRLLTRHGFKPADWDAIRTATPEIKAGSAMMTRNAIAAAAGRDLAERYMVMLFRERGQAVLEGGLQGRTAAISEAKPGTASGEFLRSAMMLKSFPTTYMMLILGRLANEIQAGRGLNKSTLAYGASIFFVGTMLGAVAKQLKNVGQGRDPEDMTTGKFWAQSFMQSGGAGIFGDFISSATNRTGSGLSTTLAGPVPERIGTLLNIVFGNAVQYARDEKTNAGRELVNLLRQNTPGMLSPWYTRLAYERLILDELQRIADPDAHKSWASKVRGQKKRQGNDMYWPPGGAPRAPNFGAAFGGP